jgi:hypothetical protein
MEKNGYSPLIVTVPLFLGYDGIKDFFEVMIPLVQQHPLIASITLNILLTFSLILTSKKTRRHNGSRKKSI